jgi:chemotaxis signal transduction protein
MISIDATAIAPFQPALCGTASECVVFALGGKTYAVAARLMRACLSLPRLTALDETPDYLVGAFDLHGELVPVVSPAVLNGRAMKPASPGDLLVVVNAGEQPLALHSDAMLGIEPVYEQRWNSPDGDVAAQAVQTPAFAAGEVLLCGGHAWVIDPAAIRLVADASAPPATSADARLKTFERQLDPNAVARLEARAERYRGLIPPARGLRGLRLP